MFFKLFPIILSALPLVFAATQIIEVGKEGNHFSPDSITASIGDHIQFKFVGEGHSVSDAAFDAPCKPVDDATFYSGHGEVGKSFTITINSTDPIWIYCPESNHCQSGMVGVINPPSSPSDKTLSAFTVAAAKAEGSSEPPAVQGGSQGDGSTSANASATTTSTSASASASTSAMASSGGRASEAAMGVLGLLSALVAGALLV
ncbi:hypothetical protein EJ08DRAFT_733508 [Tothia fuscella]|uniref:Blue (type 1) copper domain-containing protein n=1 Tax=Tothia fuscella TaxID=1048955 RepID=A0A9P4NTA7_9PEZI|nr:hypothetical protein EJ08DRAFT_733508 [Tothia fuscella]